MRKALFFFLAYLSLLVGLIKLSLLVGGQVPSSQYVGWLMLYTIGILGTAFSLQQSSLPQTFDNPKYYPR